MVQTIGRVVITVIFGITWFIDLIVMLNTLEYIYYYLIGILIVSELLLIYFGRKEKIQKPERIIIA